MSKMFSLFSFSLDFYFLLVWFFIYCLCELCARLKWVNRCWNSMISATGQLICLFFPPQFLCVFVFLFICRLVYLNKTLFFTSYVCSFSASNVNEHSSVYVRAFSYVLIFQLLLLVIASFVVFFYPRTFLPFNSYFAHSMSDTRLCSHLQIGFCPFDTLLRRSKSEEYTTRRKKWMQWKKMKKKKHTVRPYKVYMAYKKCEQFLSLFNMIRSLLSQF